MKKFIISYNTGEYDSYTDHHYGVEANSKEEVLEVLKQCFQFTRIVKHIRNINSNQRLYDRFTSLYLNVHTYWGTLPTDSQYTFEGAFPDLEIMEYDEWFESVKPPKYDLT